MKCPYCNEELNNNYYMLCNNPHCNKTCDMLGTEELWQELTKTKQALDIAVEALIYANKCIKGGCVNWETHIDRALAKITEIKE